MLLSVLPLNKVEIDKFESTSTVKGNLKTEEKVGPMRNTREKNRVSPYELPNKDLERINLVKTKTGVIVGRASTPTPDPALSQAGVTPTASTHANIDSLENRLKSFLGFDYNTKLKRYELEETYPRLQKHRELLIAESGSGQSLSDKANIVYISPSFSPTVKLPDFSVLNEDFKNVGQLGITPPTLPRGTIVGDEQRKEIYKNIAKGSYQLIKGSAKEREELKKILIESWVYLTIIKQMELMENSQERPDLLKE